MASNHTPPEAQGAAPKKATDKPPRDARSQQTFEVFGTLLGTLAILALYFTMPLASNELGAVGRIIATILIIGVLTFAILRVRGHETNLPLLIVLLVLVAATCSATFYVIAMNRPEEFEGIHTRIDALYFTLTTMTTTGYGDIHANGQLARMLVSAVFVFDLIFLGLVATEISRIASRNRQQILKKAES